MAAVINTLSSIAEVADKSVRVASGVATAASNYGNVVVPAVLGSVAVGGAIVYKDSLPNVEVNQENVQNTGLFVGGLLSNSFGEMSAAALNSINEFSDGYISPGVQFGVSIAGTYLNPYSFVGGVYNVAKSFGSGQTRNINILTREKYDALFKNRRQLTLSDFEELKNVLQGIDALPESYAESAIAIREEIHQLESILSCELMSDYKSLLNDKTKFIFSVHGYEQIDTSMEMFNYLSNICAGKDNDKKLCENMAGLILYKRIGNSSIKYSNLLSYFETDGNYEIQLKFFTPESLTTKAVKTATEFSDTVFSWMSGTPMTTENNARYDYVMNSQRLPVSIKDLLVDIYNQKDAPPPNTPQNDRLIPETEKAQENDQDEVSNPEITIYEPELLQDENISSPKDQTGINLSNNDTQENGKNKNIDLEQKSTTEENTKKERYISPQIRHTPEDIEKIKTERQLKINNEESKKIKEAFFARIKIQKEEEAKAIEIAKLTAKQAEEETAKLLLKSLEKTETVTLSPVVENPPVYEPLVTVTEIANDAIDIATTGNMDNFMNTIKRLNETMQNGTKPSLYPEAEEILTNHQVSTLGGNISVPIERVLITSIPTPTEVKVVPIETIEVENVEEETNVSPPPSSTSSTSPQTTPKDEITSQTYSSGSWSYGLPDNYVFSDLLPSWSKLSESVNTPVQYINNSINSSSKYVGAMNKTDWLTVAAICLGILLYTTRRRVIPFYRCMKSQMTYREKQKETDNKEEGKRNDLVYALKMNKAVIQLVNSVTNSKQGNKQRPKMYEMAYRYTENCYELFKSREVDVLKSNTRKVYENTGSFLAWTFARCKRKREEEEKDEISTDHKSVPIFDSTDLPPSADNIHHFSHSSISSSPFVLFS